MYDDIGSIETSWGLYRVAGDNGRKDIIQFHYSASNDALYKESICLEEGDYEFSVYDSMANDICCKFGQGYYKVTSSNGDLIVEGGEFGASLSTSFALPFVTVHRNHEHNIG